MGVAASRSGPDQAVDHQAFARGMPHGFFHHRDVELPTLESRREFQGCSAHQGKLHLRTSRRIGFQHRREAGADEIVCDAEAHHSVDRAAVDVDPDLVVEGQETASLAEKAVAGRRQAKAGPIARHQGAAREQFETGDLLADGALRQVQQSARSRHAPLVGHDREGAQETDIEVPSHADDYQS